MNGVIILAIAGAALGAFGITMTYRARKFIQQSGITLPDKRGIAQCLICGGYIGIGWKGHENTCPQLGRAELVKRLDHAERALEDYRGKRFASPWAKRMVDDNLRWRAKFHIVREENNALRRKLRALQTQGDHE